MKLLPALLSLPLLLTACGDKPPPAAPLPEETPQVAPPPEVSPAPGGAPAATAQSPVAGSINPLAFLLLQQLDPGDSSDLFFSPASVGLAMSMTAAGAQGVTLTAMQDTLGLDGLGDDPHATLGDWQRGLPAADGSYDLSVSNRIWSQRGLEVTPAFSELTAQQYGAAAQATDFSKPEAARTLINTWVAENTGDRITELMPQGSITADARMVLVNAVTFEGRWRDAFEASDTQTGTFNTAAGAQVKAQMMQRTGRYAYHQADGAQLLVLPYKGDRLSMVLLLPEDIAGYTLTQQVLQSGLAAAQSRRVQLTWPRFTLSEGYDLTAPLQKMGMAPAFGSSADFSGIAGAPGQLALSSVVHEAFLTVDEQGTEAAAATGGAISVTSIPAPPVPFTADKPFYFFIRDDSTGAILFMGRLSDPSP